MSGTSKPLPPSGGGSHPGVLNDSLPTVLFHNLAIALKAALNGAVMTLATTAHCGFDAVVDDAEHFHDLIFESDDARIATRTGQSG
jgi:hypothetical protein